MTASTIGIVAGFNPVAAKQLQERLLERGFGGRIVLSTDAFPLPSNMEKRCDFVIAQSQGLAERGCELVLVPDFATGLFIERVRERVTCPVVDILTVLALELADTNDVIGILDNVYIPSGPYPRVVLPEAVQTELNATREAMRSLGVCDATVGPVLNACRTLMAQGAKRLLPNCSHYANARAELTAHGVPLIDVYGLFVDYALAQSVTQA